MPPAARRLALLAGLAVPGLAASGLASPAQAADDVDYLFRLGMIEGHLIIGHDLVKANQAALALPHFGHPVRELYDDVSDALAEKKVPPFDAALIKLEAAEAAAPNSPETEALYQSTLKQVADARLAAPAALRASVPAMIKICADTIDAAAGEYGEALNAGKLDQVVEYHDSRGYLTYVAQETDKLARQNPDAASQALIGQFRTVLAKAMWIVEPLMPAKEPRATVGEYRTLAAQAAALVPNATPAIAPAVPAAGPAPAPGAR